MSYIIYGLPRSRTFWLSRYLSYADWTCSHDELIHCRSMEDVQSWLTMPCTGSVETLAAAFWRLVRDLPTVVVRRPLDEIMQSLANLGLTADRSLLEYLDHKLDQIVTRVPQALEIDYHDLEDEDICAAIFEHLLPYPHDHEWWLQMKSMNLQSDLRKTVRYVAAYAPQLQKLRNMAAHAILTAMQPVVCDGDDGMTIQQERFADVFRDGQRMLADHCVLVGETPDSFMSKNLELMLQLDAVGLLQFTTARCNGRMFGYLMAVLTPSLESNDMSAVHTLFFTEPCVKGLGMKLQRKSIEALRAKGVGEIIFHAGVRGSGPRLGSLYKRLGATEYGSVYRMGK